MVELFMRNINKVFLNVSTLCSHSLLTSESLQENNDAPVQMLINANSRCDSLSLLLLADKSGTCCGLLLL